jgi:hypothetical protein
LVILAFLAMLGTGCGTDASSTARPPLPSESAMPTSATPSPTPVAAASEPAGGTVAIDPDAALTQKAEAGFDPPFTLRIPGAWTAVLRDRSAYQVYAGNEEFEITFDHTYRQRESVRQAIERLERTPGLVPRRESAVRIGDRAGRGFTAGSDAAVRFGDSGFHTNEASQLEVFAIPAGDGTTVTVFLTSGGSPQHGLEALGPLARRIFATVTWD